MKLHIGNKWLCCDSNENRISIWITIDSEGGMLACITILAVVKNKPSLQ